MKNGYSAQNLRIAMSDHSGTHIDQLNHVGIRQPNGEYLIYNGIRNRDVIDTFGTKKLGIETMPPLITRGILVDVAGFKGVEYLDAGYAIQPAELDAALAGQATQVKKEIRSLCIRAGAGFGKTRRKHYRVNRDSVERAQSGQSITR